MAVFDVADKDWDFTWNRYGKFEVGQLTVGRPLVGTPRHTAIGFALPTVLPGATITSAYLQLEGLANRMTLVQSEIRAVQETVPDWPLTEDAAEEWPLTVAVVPWNDIGIQSGVIQDSPDISAVVQEVVDLPEWAGGVLVVTIKDTGSAPGQLVGWHSADSFFGAHPRLVVEWADG